MTGGLVGNNYGGTIDKAYATGNVSGSVYVGGVVGKNSKYEGGGGTVTDVYASGYVGIGEAAAPGPNYVGGVVGLDEGVVTHGYFNMDTNESADAGAGVTGLTEAQMMQQSSFVGFDPSVWRTYDGHTTPLLKSFLTPLTITVNGSGTTKVYDLSLIHI